MDCCALHTGFDGYTIVVCLIFIVVCFASAKE